MTGKKRAAFQSSTFSLFSRKQKSDQSEGHDDGKKKHSKLLQRRRNDHSQHQSSASERLDWLDYFYQWKYTADGGSAGSTWHLVSLKRSSDSSEGETNVKKRHMSVDSAEEEDGDSDDCGDSPASNVSFHSDWSKEDAVNFRDGWSPFRDRTSTIQLSVF